jgi:hypothetical protein
MALEEAGYQETELAHTNRDRFAGDENLLVRFEPGVIKDHEKTAETGRPCFKDHPWIRINVPGDRDNVFRPSRQMDYDRFPVHWEKFRAKQSQESVSGTPLEEWAGITRCQIEELKYLNIRTVEQLANVSDANVQGMMGINSIKQKAKNWLENETGTAAELKQAQNTIDALTARLDALEAKQEAPKRRGRPKKEAMEA